MHPLQITEPAERDIRSAHDWWSRNRSTEQADRWYNNVYKAIETLRSMPERCPPAPESKLYPSGLRQVSFGIGKRPTHRIVFTVEQDLVTILRVRHASQQNLTADDLK
jgi:plasmid stabilization system protein ParE